MITGVALVCVALGLLLYNRVEAKRAEQKAADVMTEIVSHIDHKTEESADFNPKQTNAQTPISVPLDVTMTEVMINGYSYIGYLAIPCLELELPIMADWDYDRLQIAPCRYGGTVNGEDLVVMAHNYPKHFGQISDLSIGDSVVFTDMDGNVSNYSVVAKDVLSPTAVKEMTSGDFDLTLFTCTYGGKSRITVYCDRDN